MAQWAITPTASPQNLMGELQAELEGKAVDFSLPCYFLKMTNYLIHVCIVNLDCKFCSQGVNILYIRSGVSWKKIGVENDISLYVLGIWLNLYISPWSLSLSSFFFCDCETKSIIKK